MPQANYIQRHIDSKLLEWKNSASRRVLLIRGARQTGKTWAVREFARSFDSFVEINFEKQIEAARIFNGNLDVHEIIDKLSAFSNVQIVLGKTVLFFDEIQSCPQCISSLRFFYEEMPGLHVVAAGSLLEFALENISSFGVGRISSLFMYPFTFHEFVSANSGSKLAEMIDRANSANPMDDALHSKLIELMRVYLAIGGMPAVVKAYCAGEGLISCKRILEDLVTVYIDDFAKYRKKAPVARLVETFESVARQTGCKFKYAHVSPECSIYESKMSLELLERAGLVYRVFHTAAQGLPLGAQINTRKFKAIFFDVGVYQRILGLDLKEHIIKTPSELINKGNTAELFAGLELIANGPSHSRPQLYYWHREEKSSNAEVDYVIQRGKTVVPIEVKSGGKGSMKSMRIFLAEHKLQKGIRASEENFCSYESIAVVPLYAVGNLVSERTGISDLFSAAAKAH
jgi:predicted AAA+ superfamily ATPase